MKTLLYAFRSLGPIDLRSIGRDSLLGWIALLPIVMALVVRGLVPPVADLLMTMANFDLSPYYALIVTYMVALFSPVIVGMIIGFLLLDERDEKTLMALQVTPMPMASYMTYRLALPMLVTVVVMLIAVPLAGLVVVPFWATLLAAIVSAAMAPPFALFFAAFARNKVEGFALGKAIGPLLILPIIGYFVPEPWQWLFGLTPTYWPAKLFWTVAEGGPFLWWVGLVGLVYSGLLVIPLLRKFEDSLRRGSD